MADSAIAITAGSGTSVDTRTEATNGQHRQVVVLGDPSVNAGVAPVDATFGLAVDVARSVIPTGAATAANQATANTSLSSIDGKITACNTAAVTVSTSALPAGAATAAKQPALGTAGVSSADVISVQGIASGTAMPISAASLPLPSGAATLAKQPALGTAGTASADVISVQGIASMTPLHVDHADTAPGTSNITVVDSGSSTASGANSQSIITGTATANSSASFTLSGHENVSVQVTGTWTGTLQVEISFDSGTTWYIRGTHQIGTAYTAAAFTANFAGNVNVAGMTNFRVRATAAMTGTATVKVVESLNPSSVYIANSIKLIDQTTATQGLAISAAGAAKVDGSAVTQPVSQIATTTGGYTPFKLISAATTNATSVKGSAGHVHSYQFYNANAAVRYVKLYDKASAPTVGSDVPVFVIAVPPGSGNNCIVDAIFASGIALATTTGVTDADTTAVAINEIVMNIQYK